MKTLMQKYVFTPLMVALFVCIGLPLSLLAFGQLGLLGVGGSTVAAGSGLPAILSATTYYVCAKGAGGTCVYNGDAGTTATPSDSNDCLTKGTPCASIAGVNNKISGQALAAVVTVQLADTAGTGTDCYSPANVVMNNEVFGSNPVDSWENANGVSMQYPLSYIYLHGNDTTPNNVIVTGASTCAGTSASAVAGIRFDHTNARVRGMKMQYFGAGGSTNQTFGGGITGFRSTIYIEDVNYTSDSTSSTVLAYGYRYSYLIFGNSVGSTFTNADVFIIASMSQAQFVSPLGRANLTVSDSSTGFRFPAVFTSADNSWVQWDAATLTVSGTATHNVWAAIDHSGVNWSDASTFTTPTQTISINGSGWTTDIAERGSYINDLCRTTGSLVCNIGNTTQIAFRVKADTSSYINVVANGTSVANDATVSNNASWQGPSRGFGSMSTITFSQLGTPANGSYVFCTDCAPASSPCTGTSTGTMAIRMNGAWKCF